MGFLTTVKYKLSLFLKPKTWFSTSKTAFELDCVIVTDLDSFWSLFLERKPLVTLDSCLGHPLVCVHKHAQASINSQSDWYISCYYTTVPLNARFWLVRRWALFTSNGTGSSGLVAFSFLGIHSKVSCIDTGSKRQETLAFILCS